MNILSSQNKNPGKDNDVFPINRRFLSIFFTTANTTIEKNSIFVAFVRRFAATFREMIVDTTDLLEIATCTAITAFGAVAFSFSITSWNRWPKLSRCRRALIFSFSLVLASEILKLIFPGRPVVNDAVTFVECFAQLELLSVMSFVFIDPDIVVKRWIGIAFAPGIASAVIMISCAFLAPGFIQLATALSTLLLLGQIIYLGLKYGKIFLDTLNRMSRYYDSDYSGLYRLEILFFAAVGVGFIVTATTFHAHEFYIGWKVLFLLFYLSVTVLFLNYESYAPEVRNVNSHDEITESLHHSVPTVQSHGMEEFKQALENWVSNKSYLVADLPTEEIAHNLGVDITEFRSYFRDIVGKDFRTWRQELRIDEACHIMKEHPQYSYDTVAAMVGINDRSNFNKYFQRFKGCSPREWKASGNQQAA